MNIERHTQLTITDIPNSPLSSADIPHTQPAANDQLELPLATESEIERKFGLQEEMLFPISEQELVAAAVDKEICLNLIGPLLADLGRNNQELQNPASLLATDRHGNLLPNPSAVSQGSPLKDGVLIQIGRQVREAHPNDHNSTDILFGAYDNSMKKEKTHQPIDEPHQAPIRAFRFD